MRTRLIRLALLGLAAGSLAGPMHAPAPSAAAPASRPASPSVSSPASTPAPPGCGDPTPAALAGYFDTTVPDLLARNNVPGAAVAVVSGGATVFAQGYGLSDVEHGTAFSATDSLVRIASITKLFTWTAVMQQVEAGRLDLDTDVNTYLSGLRIPDAFGAPVTLRTLMNHTAGFEDGIIGTAARTAADVPSLRDVLAARIPARIYPPGEISAYSNYGAALAGFIVAEVSGEPYHTYVQRHLLDPLGMRHSTATEPVPDALAGGLAHSYNSDTTPPELVPFEFDQLPPDGSVSATASDLARFMAAHLDPAGGGILAPATMAEMHRRSFAADPRLAGYAHGFQDRTINGHRVLMHDGSWEGFLSALVLVPDCGLGFFITTNATGGIEAARAVMDGFFDRYAPAVTQSISDGAAATATAAPAAGFYRLTRHNESTMEKLLVLLGPARLTLDPDGTVHFKGRTWTSQGDGLYAEVGGPDRLVFRAGTDGRRYVATNGPSYELMGSAETLPVNLVVLLVFALPALTAPAVPLVALWRRIRRRRRTARATTTPTSTATSTAAVTTITTATSTATSTAPASAPVPWRWARALAAGAALTGLAFLLGLFATLAGDTGDFIYGAPVSFLLLLTLPVVTLAVAAAAAGLTVRAWRGPGVRRVARAHQLALLVGLTALGWFAWQWNLIGWQV
jgi:CubicO group peptidase (beta-lactamase class C family)